MMYSQLQSACVTTSIFYVLCNLSMPLFEVLDNTSCWCGRSYMTDTAGVVTFQTHLKDAPLVL